MSKESVTEPGSIPVTGMAGTSSDLQLCCEATMCFLLSRRRELYTHFDEKTLLKGGCAGNVRTLSSIFAHARHVCLAEGRRFAVFDEYYLQTDSLQAAESTHQRLAAACKGADHILSKGKPAKFYLLFCQSPHILEVDSLCHPSSVCRLAWPQGLPQAIDTADVLSDGTWCIVSSGQFLRFSVQLSPSRSNAVQSNEALFDEGLQSFLHSRVPQRKTLSLCQAPKLEYFAVNHLAGLYADVDKTLFSKGGHVGTVRALSHLFKEAQHICKVEDRCLAVFDDYYFEAEGLNAVAAKQYALDAACRGADHMLVRESPVTFYLLFCKELRVVEVDCLCRPSSLRILAWPANLPDSVDSMIMFGGGDWGIISNGRCLVASASGIQLGSQSSSVILKYEVTINQDLRAFMVCHSGRKSNHCIDVCSHSSTHSKIMDTVGRQRKTYLVINKTLKLYAGVPYALFQKGGCIGTVSCLGGIFQHARHICTVNSQRLAVYDRGFAVADKLTASEASMKVLHQDCRGADHIFACGSPVYFLLFFADGHRMVHVDDLCRPSIVRHFACPPSFIEDLDAAVILPDAWAVFAQGKISSFRVNMAERNLSMTLQSSIGVCEVLTQFIPSKKSAAAEDPTECSNMDAASAITPDHHEITAMGRTQLEEAACELMKLRHLADASNPELKLPANDIVRSLITERFESSLESHRASMKCLEKCEPPRIEIIDVFQLSNPGLKQAYMGYCLRALDEYPDGISPIEGMAADRVSAGKNLNEYYLYHGAPTATVPLILQRGFDPRRGGEFAGRMFGTGSYFAQNASKADLYTEPDIQGVRTILLCRVMLGNTYYTKVCMPQITKPPDTPANIPHDSVTAMTRNEGGAVDFREYIIYKELQALPLYKILYRHVQLCRCRTCRFPLG